jgi:hypothetical protein
MRTNKILSILISASLIGAMVSGLFPAQAATAILTTITVTPASTLVSTATNVTIVFTPVTSTTTNTVMEVSYDPLFTGGAALVDGDITVTNANITAKVCSGFVAGYFKCTITASAPVTTAITTVIGNTHKLTTPGSAGNYSFSISDWIGGAGTGYDVGAGLAYIANENQVLITSKVVPVLALDLYNAGTATLMTNPNTCSLGVQSINRVTTCSYDVGVGTNDTTGATLKVNGGAAMTNGSTTIANATGAALVAGTEAYGFYISAAGSKFTAAGSYITPVQAVPIVETTLATSAAVSDKLTIAQHLTIVHSLAISTSTATGDYTQTDSYTVYTK